MKRIISMLLVCLMLVQMLPLGIHTHAEEMETAPAETVSVETTEATEAAETTAPAETEEETQAPAEETAAEETAATEMPAALELPIDPDAEQAQTIRVIMENQGGDWVMTSAEQVELPEGFGLPEEGGITPSAVGDNSYKENEPNNSTSYAGIVYNDYTVSGTLSSSDLLDYFTFYLSSRSEVIIVAVAKYSSFMMGVWDSYDECIGADTTGEYGSSTYSYNLYGTISSGRYYLCMLDSNKSYNSYMFYITITPVSSTCSHSSYTSVVTAPTCGSQGYTTYTCSSCSYTWKGNYTDATGEHTYTDDTDMTCDVCGATREIGVASGTCGASLYWVLDEEGTLTISGTGAMYDFSNYGTDQMPWEEYADDIKSVVIESGATSIGKYAFYFCELTSVSIPDTVTAINENAFYNCDKLKAISLPGNLKTIGDDAFEYCESLTTVSIPASVTSIGDTVFHGCSDLTGIWVDSGNSYYCSDSSGVLYNKAKTILYEAPDMLEGDYVIASGVTQIAKWAFSGCEEMTGITIPDTVTAIGASAFSYCKKLKSVVIPDGVTVLDGYTFHSCDAMTSITLSENLTAIDSHEFSGSGLKSITIPAKVTSLGGYSLSSCSDLGKIIFLGDAPTFKDTTFNNVTATAYYPAGNSTWTSSVMLNYGGSIIWVGTCTNHVAVTIPGKAATCTATGLTEGSYCSVCNETLVEQQTIPALGHTSVTIPAVAATCTATGLTEGSYCSVCNETLAAQQTIPALGHASVTIPAVAATCTATGLTEGSYCSRCNETLVAQQTIPALGHVAVTDSAVAPTCTAVGLTEGSHCSRCKVVLVAQQTIPALGHVEVVDAAVAATCETAGLTEGKHCSRCNAVLVAQQTIPALGHDEIIDSPAVAPTCVSTGLTKASHCSRCKVILAVQEVIPALGHVETVDEAKAPTCEEIGLTEGKHCDRCQEILVAQEEIPALGHTSAVDAYLAPTCEETGLTEGSHCSVCEKILVAQEEIPALGHSYEDHMCTVCGQSEFVEVTAICTDKAEITYGEAANLTAVLDYPIREDTEIVWTLAEGDDAFVTLETNRDTAVLTAKRLLEEAIVTVYAESAEGLCDPVGISIVILPMEADYQLFAGKSVTIKPINPATGKAYSAKELTWSMDSRYEPFVKFAKGKITAQKVVEKARVEVVATVNTTGEELRYVVDIFPAATQVEVKNGGEIVNGKTVLMDFAEESLTLKVDTYPLDTLENVTWTISDKNGQYAEYAIDGDTLTISNPKGKAGIVTIKATVDAGVKKNITVKVQFGSFAKVVEIFEPTKTSLRSGESITLSGYVSDPVVVSKPGLVWTTSNKLAATVSSAGKVTAKAVAHPTIVTITATSKDGQASASVDLEIIPKNEGQLVLKEGDAFVTNATKAINYGDTCQISAYSIVNGESVAETVTWTSAKETVAYVENGLITATGVGTAKITATAADGRSAVINVKVSTLVDAMTITTKDGKNLDAEGNVVVASGKTVTLVANIPTQGANKAVTWEITEGAQYAKLSNGKVTANKDLTKPVSVTVKATAKDGSGVSATITVKIQPLATGVQIFESGSRVRSNTTYISDLNTNPVIKLNAKVYPAKASQEVELTSSNKKIAEFIDGELVCYKTGTVTITAKALDGSNAKTTFKLTIVKKITDLTLKDNLPLDKEGNLYVSGGKSLKLSTMVQINPGDATNKKLNWSVAPNDLGAKISTSGVLTTKKVTKPETVNIMVTTNDGSGVMLSFNVTIYPA